MLRRGDPLLALLLDAVQDERGFFELHGVDGAVRATGIVIDHLEHTGAAKALEHLRCVMLIARLSKGQCITKEPPHARTLCATTVGRTTP